MSPIWMEALFLLFGYGSALIQAKPYSPHRQIPLMNAIRYELQPLIPVWQKKKLYLATTVSINIALGFVRNYGLDRRWEQIPESIGDCLILTSLGLLLGWWMLTGIICYQINERIFGLTEAGKYRPIFHGSNSEQSEWKYYFLRLIAFVISFSLFYVLNGPLTYFIFKFLPK